MRKSPLSSWNECNVDGDMLALCVCLLGKQLLNRSLDISDAPMALGHHVAYSFYEIVYTNLRLPMLCCMARLCS